MPNQLRIDVVSTTTATPAAVWRLIADVETWSDWGRWESADLERPGAPEPGGLGAVRRLTFRRRTNREEVVGFEPPSRFAYKLLSGLPLRNYTAEVTLAPSGEGTRLEWHSRFDPTLTGRLLRPFLARFIRDAVARMLRAAEAG